MGRVRLPDRGITVQGERRDLPSVQEISEAVHAWVQKIGGYLRTTLAKVNGDLPEVLVADETELHVGERTLYLWVALDPATRAIVHLALTEGRNILFARSFLLGIKARYGSLSSSSRMAASGILLRAGSSESGTSGWSVASAPTWRGGTRR